ncbi:MAG: adenylyltransferase/cytidyltransferase family protein [Planctomycetes bacterium]|nr:adenylyltransferase/cytidyltransferase family protein [Planctomycetota bacterium]
MGASKIYMEPETLVPHLAECRRRGLRVVFANGCFELIHVGHVRYLQAAKKLGDVLVVAVNTDESMRAIKPDRRPVNPDAERCEIVAALEAVDFVVPLRETTPLRLIEMFRPEIHTKGTDYTLEQIPERAAVLAYGGRVELVGGPKVRNTRDLLRELKDR